MGNSIPTAARAKVRAREHFQCLRCPGRGAEVHHRRRRGVRDGHTHCPCNLVYLCLSCHHFITHHPHLGRREGFIVSAFVEQPTIEQIQTWRGTLWLDCDGSYLKEQPQ